MIKANSIKTNSEEMINVQFPIKEDIEDYKGGIN